LRPAIEDVYIRTSDGLVTRPVAGYRYGCQLGDLHWPDFHWLDHQFSFTALSRRTKISLALTIASPLDGRQHGSDLASASRDCDANSASRRECFAPSRLGPQRRLSVASGPNYVRTASYRPKPWVVKQIDTSVI